MHVALSAIKIGSEAVSAPVALAPMAGITDRPFRRIAARFGAPYVVSEMVASREMLCDRSLSAIRLDVAQDTALAGVQLAGCEAHWMAEAARRVEGNGARVIDINMGCPAKKVTTGYSGSALMRAPDKALSLIEATVEAVSVPVTLKMRLGWDDETLTAVEIARRAEAAGIQMLVIHGRTRAQLYRGKADWAAVRAVVDAVDIPVLVNGDIIDVAAAGEALAQSGATGVMVGRATQGAPWVVGQIAAALSGADVPEAPTGGALRDVVVEHYEGLLECYGSAIGSRAARKHIGWWLAKRPDGEALRGRVIRSEDTAYVLRELSAYDWPDVVVGDDQVAA